MPSDNYQEAYVWVWLPGETGPVVAGRLEPHGDQLAFMYGQSYLARDNAISLYEPELPLQSGEIPLRDYMDMPSCIRDASPDAWGRRVILYRKTGERGHDAETAHLDELTYLLESGSDRIGGLDFQLSPTEYVPRASTNAPIEELLEAADRIDKGLPISPELAEVLRHGTSIGGARPKALIEEADKKYIAKFSTASDQYNVVKAEFVAMRLAFKAGLDVAPARLESAAGKDVILVERFDRVTSNRGWQRKIMLSGLTMLGLNEMQARYASYEDFAELIRFQFADAGKDLKELYSRLVFNVLVGNTDDHARNHAAFWDGSSLSLTPGYDICPQLRTGNEATQAMAIIGDNRQSNLATCLAASNHFTLSTDQAVELIKAMVESIASNWDGVCKEAKLTHADKQVFSGRMFFNPYVFEGLAEDIKAPLLKV